MNDDFLINSPEFKRAKKLLENEILDLEKLILKKAQARNEEGGSEVIHVNADEALVTKLNNEINNLQKTLAEIGKENEILLEENRSLSYKLSNIKKQAPNFINEIESDLAGIKNILKE